MILGKSGSIWYFGILQSGCIREGWLYSGKSVCIRSKVVLFGQTDCVRAKVVVFGKKCLYSGKSG